MRIIYLRYVGDLFGHSHNAERERERETEGIAALISRISFINECRLAIAINEVTLMRNGFSLRGEFW